MYSMTGYGRATNQADGRTMTIELKSVNHRFLDLNFRMPRSFAFLEDAARKAIAGKLSRGHVDVFCTYVNLRDDSKIVTADMGLVKAYMTALDEIEKETGLRDDRSLSLISRLPDALRITENAEDEEALKELMLKTMNDALDNLNAMRLKEGEAMKADMLLKISEIEKENEFIEKRYPETVLEYQAKLKARVEELLGGQLDESRLAQEVAIMADRAAIAEENVRLKSHIRQAREKCALSEPVGRSLDFIVQEMNREVNTISSKSQDIPITQSVIACKSAIEKLREQLQNVE
ncbi:MAG: YicC family protein [Clostridia bacterium]|nr:YicC family protein [Clostridia bacterium]